MSLKSQIGLLARALDHAREPSRGERRAALRSKNERRLRLLLPLYPPQCSQFIADYCPT
jgi:hypothetical protein